MQQDFFNGLLKHCWKNGYRIRESAVCLIDAKTHFGAAVGGCLFVAAFGDTAGSSECDVYGGLGDSMPTSTFGLQGGQLIANLSSYDRWHHLFASSDLKWRSGVKHDCTPVMELLRDRGGFRNGFGEVVKIESECLYPMYKGSDIAKGDLRSPTRWMIVPQRAVSEDTSALKEVAPRTWKYLSDHGHLLDRRGSSIYKKRARFSIFGVGDYTFRPWKVVISALHKQPRFSVAGSFEGKPIVLDDTCYFLPCDSHSRAKAISSALNSTVVRDALSSYVFWDSKRPITTEVLNQLNLAAIARELGWDWEDVTALGSSNPDNRQAKLFI